MVYRFITIVTLAVTLLVSLSLVVGRNTTIVQHQFRPPLALRHSMYNVDILVVSHVMFEETNRLGLGFGEPRTFGERTWKEDLRRTPNNMQQNFPELTDMPTLGPNNIHLL